MYAQIGCLLLGYLATAFCAASTFWSSWAVSTPDSSSVMWPIKSWKGAWSDCYQVDVREYRCMEQGSMFMAEGYQVAIQALMCMSICMSSVSCLLMHVGMECSRLLDGSASLKRKLMYLCALIFFVAGIFELVSSSWYASMVVGEFYSLYSRDHLIKYELGPSLYLCFVASFLSFCTAAYASCMPGPKTEPVPYVVRANAAAYSLASSNRPVTNLSEVKSSELVKTNKGTFMEYV